MQVGAGSGEKEGQRKKHCLNHSGCQQHGSMVQSLLCFADQVVEHFTFMARLKLTRPCPLMIVSPVKRGNSSATSKRVVIRFMTPTPMPGPIYALHVYLAPGRRRLSDTGALHWSRCEIVQGFVRFSSFLTPHPWILLESSKPAWRDAWLC